MQKILEGVRRFREIVYPDKRALFERLAGGQSPAALFIACSDSRVHPDLITQTDPGDLFILRNPGNIVPPYRARDDSASATVEYAVEVLGVADVIVCGHSDCGAIKALLNGEQVRHLSAVTGWLSHAEVARRIVESQYADLPVERRVQIGVEQNVLVQLDHLRTHPSVAAATAAGRLRLHAWVYDIAPGEVRQYDRISRRFESLVEQVRLERLALQAAV